MYKITSFDVRFDVCLWHLIGSEWKVYCSCAFDSVPILKHFLTWCIAFNEGLLYSSIKPYQGHLYGNTKAWHSDEACRMGIKDHENIFSISIKKRFRFCLWIVIFYLKWTFFCLKPLHHNSVTLSRESELALPVKILNDKTQWYAYSLNSEASCWKGAPRAPTQCQAFTKMLILLAFVVLCAVSTVHLENVLTWFCPQRCNCSEFPSKHQ